MNPLSDSTSAPMCVLSIDPGITTGFVTAYLDEDKITVHPYQHPDCTVSWLWRNLNIVKPAHIVCEDFEFRRNLEWAELYPVQLIGVVNLYAELTQETRVWMQKATAIHGKSKIDGKWIYTAYYHDKDKLKEKDVYIPGEEYHHSMDAMRHFLHWYDFGAGHRFYKEGVSFQLIKS